MAVSRFDAAIHTRRLRLWALPRPALGALYTGASAFEREFFLHVARGMLTDAVRRAVARKLSRMQAAPEDLHPWHTYWLALRRVSAEPQAIGLLGFKGPPDAAGEVEISYSIDPSHQGRGYATEAARALVAWAFSNNACRAVIAPNTPTVNQASVRVLQKLGMHVYAATSGKCSYRLEKEMAFVRP